MKDVKEMFNRIASSYDKTNGLLSFGIHKYWRRKLIHYLPKKNVKILDIATGTGDQIFALLGPSITSAVGIDIAEKMLKIAEEKKAKRGVTTSITFVKGSALSLPFKKEEFDVVTLSFGIRNIPSIEKSLKEAFRVLQVGGKLLILEFSIPENALTQKIYLFYLRRLLPFVGFFVSKDKSAYRYLSDTIQSFPSGEAFTPFLEKSGFQKVSFVPFTFGTVTLYIGEKV